MESARFGTFAAADRATLHELNTRLARYVEHVQRLEARNHALRSELLAARRQRGSAPGAIDTRDAKVRRSRETVRVLSLEVARDALLRERLRGERAWQQARLESEERGLHELQAASEAAMHEVEEQRAFGAELEAGAERIAREMESACETHTREMSAWRTRLQQLQRVSVYASPVNVFPTEEELLALESTAAKAGILVAERLEGELMSYTEELNHEQVQKQETEQEVAGLAQMLQNLQLKAAEVSEQRVHLEHTAREMEERFHSHLASLQERAEDLEQESSELQMVALQQSRESRELAAAEMRLRLEIAAYRSMLQMECGDPMFDEKEQQLRIQQKGLRQQQQKSWMHSPHKYYPRTDVGPSLRTHTETAKVNRRRHDWICNQRVKSPTMLTLNRSPQTAFGLSRSKRLSGESAARSSSVKIQHSMEGKTIHGIQKEQKSDVSIYKIQELSEQSSEVSPQTETDVAENKVHDIVPTAYEMEPASKYIEDPNRIGTIEEKKEVESGDLSTLTSLELLKEDSFETTPAAESVMESCTVAITDKQKDELISEHVGTNSVVEYPEECEQTLISDDVDKTNAKVASLPPAQQGNESEMHENAATDSQTTDIKEQYFPLLMETEPLEEQNPQPYDTCAKTEEPVLSPSSQLYLDEQPLGIHEGDNVFTDPENWEEVQNACERLEATTRSTDLQLTKEGEMSLDLPENSEKDDRDRNVEFDLELPSTNKICVISTAESSAQEDDINIIEGLDKQYIHPERPFSPKDKDSSFQLELEMTREREEESLQPKQQFHEIVHKEEAYSGTCDDVFGHRDVISQSEENITDSVTEVTETLKTHDSEVEDFTVSVGTSSSMSPHSKEDHIYDYGKTYGTTEEIHELHINESSEEERQSSHESALQVLESTSEAEHVLQDESLALPQEVQEISTKELKLEEPFSPLSEQTDMTKEAVLKKSSEIIPSKMMECNIAEQAKVIFECEEELDELTLTRADDESYCIEEEEESVGGDAPATNSSLKYGDYQEMVHSEEELRDEPSQQEEPDQVGMHGSNASQNEADVTSDADDEIGEEIKVFGHKHLLKDQLPTRLLTDNVPETPVDFPEEAPDHCKETLPDIPTSDLERSLLEYQNTTSESVPQTTGTEIQAPGLKKEKKVESRYTEVEADVPGGDVALNIVEKETKERKKRLRRRGKKNQTPLAHRSDDTTMKLNLQRGDSERSVDHKSEQESRLYEESAIPHEEASTRSNECELKVSGSLVEVWTEKGDTISTDGMENVAVSFTADNVSLKQMEEGKDKQEWEGAQDESHIHEDMEQFPRTDIDSFTGKNVTDSGFVDSPVSDMCILSTSVGALSKSTTSESLQDEGATFQQDCHEYFLTREGVAGETHIPESESKDESTVIENGLVKTDEGKERKSYKPDDCAVEPDDSFKLQPNQLEEFSHAGEYPGCEDRNVVTDQECFGEQGKENVKELTVQHQEYYSKLSNKKDLTEDMSECDVHDKNHNKKVEDHYVDIMDDFQILPWKDRLSGGDDETSLQNVWRSKNETAQELFKEGGDDQQVTSEIDSLSSQPSLEPPSLTEDGDDVTHEEIRRPDSKSPQILPVVRGDSEDGGDVYVDGVQLTWLSQDTRSFPVVEVFSESSTTGIEKSESSLGLQEKEELLEKEEQSLKASKEDDQKFPSEKAYQVLEAVDATDISKEVSIDYEKERFEKQYQSSEYVTVSVQPLDDEEQTLIFVEDEQNIENVVIPEELESSGDELDKAFAETKNDEQSLSDEKLDEVVTLSDDENCPTTSKNVEEISAMEEVKLITTKLSPEEKISVVEEGSEPTLEEIHNMSNLFKFQQENGTQPFAEIVLEQTPTKAVDSQTIFIVDEGNEKYPDAQEMSDMTQKVEKQDDPALKLKEILRDISTIGAVPLDEQTISFGLNQDKVTGSAVIQSPGLFESDSVKTWHEIKKEKQLFHCEDEYSKILMQDNVEESKQSQNAPISGEFIFEQTGEEQSFLSSKEDEGEKQTMRSESTDKMSPSVYKEERHFPSDERDDHLLSESETTQSTLAAGQEQRSPPNEEIPADSKRQCQEMVELRIEEYLNPSQAILPNVETQVYADFNQNKPERFTDGDSTIQADTEYGRPETSLYGDDEEKELTEFEWHAEQVKSKALDFQVFPELDAGELDELGAGHSSFTPEDFTTTDEAKENELSGIMPISATCSFGTSDSIIQEAIALGNDTPIESDDFHFTSLTQEENVLPSLGTTTESSLAHLHAEDAPEASSTFVKLEENQEGFGKENDEIAEENDEIDTMFQQNYHSYRLTNSNQPVLVDTGEQQVGFMFLDESNVSFQGHSLH
uniref:IF rod domain-containing protein n=1 Tax=Eptatretus burgeri TaxID=7764 RepID=A0A8C4Q2G9_EPTBU